MDDKNAAYQLLKIHAKDQFVFGIYQIEQQISFYSVYSVIGAIEIFFSQMYRNLCVSTFRISFTGRDM